MQNGDFQSGSWYSLAPIDWDNLIHELRDPATADRAARQCVRFISAQLLAGDGGKKLQGLSRRLDPVDMQQSVFKSFCGKWDDYDDRPGDEIRALLVGIVNNKLNGKVRHHLTPRRDIRKEESADDGDREKGRRPVANDNPVRVRPSRDDLPATVSAESSTDPAPLVESGISRFSVEQLESSIVQGATPEQTVFFREIADEMPEELRAVFAFTLAGHTGDEIAELLVRSRRFVVRKQALIRIFLVRRNSDELR